MDIGTHFGSSSNRADEPKIEHSFRKPPRHQCQCSGSSQIFSQYDLNVSHQFTSLYKLTRNYDSDRTELIIYNIENGKEEAKVLDARAFLDGTTCMTQLPNGELFCYGSSNSEITLIIDKNYEVRMLTPGTSCQYSSALYFENSIYCFGGSNNGKLALSRKFDLEKNRWVNLPSLPGADVYCHSAIFNGNILISGSWNKNLWLYSIEINSFSIIPYGFSWYLRKILIYAERLYLIEWAINGMIYESEDEYNWNIISKSGQLLTGPQIYCSYNKEKIYISTWNNYYQFDLKKDLCIRLIKPKT